MTDFEWLIPAKEAATLLGSIHVKTIQRWARRGEVPAHRIGSAPDDSQPPAFKGKEGGQQGTDGTLSPEASDPSIFTMIQEQLGLKLESQKAPGGETLVIDHVEKPAEN